MFRRLLLTATIIAGFAVTTAFAQTQVGPVPSTNGTLVNPTVQGGTVDSANVTATGSSTARTLGDRAADVVNVKDYGAKGDSTSISNCTIATQSSALLCTAASFKASDVGKYYYLQGTGASGVPQTGTITGVTDATHITLSQPAISPSRRFAYFNGPSVKMTPAAPGSGYVPGDTLTLVGGTFDTATTVVIATTKPSSVTTASGGSGGTNGTCTTITGTTGTGTKFIGTGTISGGALTGAITLTTAGDYSVNPTNLSAEPVTGCSLTGATVALTMGWSTATTANANPGAYVTGPTSPAATTTSGSGTGATVNITAYQVSGKFIYGTDDTAAIAAGIAKATALNGTLFFPTGAYWAATQTTPFVLNNLAIKGSGRSGYDFPYTSAGASILISNKSTTAFSGIKALDWDGIGIFYPEQDGSQTTPIAFPPLFDGVSTGTITNVSFRNMRVANAYEFLRAGTGLGRVTMTNNTIYCVLYCLNYQAGSADTFSVDATNYFGPGAFDNGAPYGPFNLGKFTATNGEFLHADTVPSGVPTISGLMMDGFIMQGMRYGFRIVSGTVSVSNFSNLNFDAIQTPLSIEGAACWISTAMSGGEIYATNIYDASANGNVFNNTSNCQSHMVITGVHITFALGHVFYDATGGYYSSVFSGNRVGAWGQSTTNATYYGIFQAGGNAGAHSWAGNVFDCKRITGNQINAIGTATTGGSVSITGNAFRACSNDLILAGTAGSITVAGNGSSGTVSNSASDSSTGSLIVRYGPNAWDRPVVYRKPTAVSCGTTPSLSSLSDNFDGTITVGTGGVTSCTLTFTTTLPAVPRSVTVTSGSTTTGAVAAGVPTTSAVVITSATDMSGMTLNYHVVQ